MNTYKIIIPVLLIACSALCCKKYLNEQPQGYLSASGLNLTSIGQLGQVGQGGQMNAANAGGFANAPV